MVVVVVVVVVDMMTHRAGGRLAEPVYCLGYASTSPPPLVVGCALRKKKIHRYLTPDFVRQCARAGVEMRLVDLTQPLASQGPYDVLLHKIYAPSWPDELAAYSERFPHTTIIDRMDAVLTLADRQTMLTALKELTCVRDPNSPGSRNPNANASASAKERVVEVRVPRQVTVSPGDLAAGKFLERVRTANLRFPLLLKPAEAQGEVTCHTVALVVRLEGLQELEDLAAARATPLDMDRPLIAQEYIRHDGVIHKFYVLGSRVVVDRRPSLTEMDVAGMDPTTHGHGGTESSSLSSSYSASITPTTDVKFFRQLSRRPFHPTKPQSADEAAREAEVADLLCTPSTSANVMTPEGQGEGVVVPEWFAQGLGDAVKSRLGLSMFNMDVILEGKDGTCDDNRGSANGGNGHHGHGGGSDQHRNEDNIATVATVVDINYFPGFDKLTDWQVMFVEFLLEKGAEHRAYLDAVGLPPLSPSPTTPPSPSRPPPSRNVAALHI